MGSKCKDGEMALDPVFVIKVFEHSTKNEVSEIQNVRLQNLENEQKVMVSHFK